MPFRWNPREHVALGRYFLKWLLIGAPAGAIIGASVAMFLWALETVTTWRWQTDTSIGLPWLLFLLPVAGIGIGLMYSLFGKSVEGGNNLIMEQIHEPGGGVPSRMAPLVLIGTVVTHLFGGSAGREGTAIQMGGSIASTIARWCKFNAIDTRTLLMIGIAGGFGSVFGVPLTGAIFAVEVLAIGLVDFQSIVPCLIASVVGDWTTRACGIHHQGYSIAAFAHLNLIQSASELSWPLLGKVAIAAVAFGLASVIFAELTHGLQRVFKWALPWPILRPALGGAVVILLAYFIGADYLGIGVKPDPHYPHQVCIVSSFRYGGATYWSWWWKILFTAVTLSSGFKGGEVTPLFFVGAAMGNTMARLLHAPIDLFAGLGFVAVFAGATNTPLACTVMGIELFAGQSDLVHSGFVVYLATACFLANLLSGHSGIYLSQRIGTPKLLSPDLPPDISLRRARELQPPVGSGLIAMFTRNNEVGIASVEVMPTIPAEESVTINESNGEFNGESNLNGGSSMPHRHKVTAREIGQVRIYMTPAEKRKGSGMKALFARPLYQEIIDAAKADGILNAVAHHTHYGYSGNGQVQSNNQELPNNQLNLCVELIAHRDQLELFCRKHGELIKGKVIVYKHMEHWDIGPHDALKTKDAPAEDLDTDVQDDVSESKD